MASGSLIPQTFSGSFWSMFSDPSASQLPASLSGAFDGMKAWSDNFAANFWIPFFLGDFLLLFASWKLFKETLKILFPQQAQISPSSLVVPTYKENGASMNSRGGFIDVFNGLRIFGLVFVFSVFAVFAANMGTQFLTLLSPYLVMVAWPLKILGYHNASMALFFVNLTVYLVVRIVDGFRKFSLG